MYPAVKKYLSLWKTDESGLTELRKGGWFWGDWGSNKDMHLIMAGWHHIALKGAAFVISLFHPLHGTAKQGGIFGVAKLFCH